MPHGAHSRKRSMASGVAWQPASTSCRKAFPHTCRELDHGTVDACVYVCVLEVIVTGRAGRLRDVFKPTELPVQPPAEYLTDTHLLTTHFVLGR